jgi:hypothetical protein
MMAHAALLAALTVFLIVGWIAGELAFLIPYRAALFHRHGLQIAGATLLLFFNLAALYYAVGRWLLLGDAGRKLRHLDHQLTTSDAVLDDLGRDLTS